MFWALMIVVSLKYVVLIMRADNRGEGGIMALIALASTAVRDQPQWRLPLSLIGACRRVALLRRRGADAGDLGALGGRGPAHRHHGVQSLRRSDRGRRAGRPVRVPGARHRGGGAVLRADHDAVVRRPSASPASTASCASPSVLQALNPLHALSFVTGHGAASFVVLGAVVLAVTGAEALYADMGHFGKKPVRIAWFSLVAPALVLNYFGQGALLMAQPEAVTNPFYLAAAAAGRCIR